jgi:hypothetical protein
MDVLRMTWKDLAVVSIEIISQNFPKAFEKIH